MIACLSIYNLLKAIYWETAQVNMDGRNLYSNITCPSPGECLHHVLVKALFAHVALVM